MSLNKFMHPRNRYRKPPNFKALAIKYPDFRKYAKQDISGKVSLDFKNLESVRALTCTLLKEDFNLDVEIPLDRLIPTLPLRLNYLLWIEDLLLCNNINKDAKGIDIGCGASCIYPLLAAKHFGWCMLATETDCESVKVAVSNVQNNKLEHMITVKPIDRGNMLEGVVNDDSQYDFCMCNPPFFSCMEELSPEHVARSPNRPPPRNAHSGSTGELVVPGGEIAFIAQIIQDSVNIKKLIRIYTVMAGHKSSVSKVKQLLKEAGVTQIASTEFCQGHTTRWGVAWTMNPDIVLPQVKDAPLSNKKKVPFTHSTSSNLSSTVSKLHQLMDQLQMTYSTQKSNQEINVMDVTAMTNTWSNSRKKRRQENRITNMAKDNKELVLENVHYCVEKESEEIKNKKICLGEVTDGESKKRRNNSMSEIENEAEEKHLINKSESSEESKCSSLKCSRSEDREGSDSRSPKMFKTDGEVVDGKSNNSRSNSMSEIENKAEEKHAIQVRSSEESTCSSLKRSRSEGRVCSYSRSPKMLKTDIDNSKSDISVNNDPFLIGQLIVRRKGEFSVIELFWLRGGGGRDAAHQVLQYFKNNLDVH